MHMKHVVKPRRRERLERRERYAMLLTTEERDTFEAAAERANLTLSSWLRMIARREAER